MPFERITILCFAASYGVTVALELLQLLRPQAWQRLIATAFGLLIAMIALLPFNFLNSRLEGARQEIENAAAHLELVLLKSEKQAAVAEVP